MSDNQDASNQQFGDTQGSEAPATQETAAAIPQSIQVPKHRLDEEIQRRYQLERELETMKAVMTHLAPKKSAEPRPEHPALLKVKEENPELYAYLKKQELQSKQVSAALYDEREIRDRQDFIQYAGQKEANRVGRLVDQKIEELRKNGMFHMNRTDVYNYMVGQEAIAARRNQASQAGGAAAPKGTVAAAATPQRTAQEILDAPTSDTQSQGVITGGAATRGTAQPSLEELEAKLANLEF